MIKSNQIISIESHANFKKLFYLDKELAQKIVCALVSKVAKLCEPLFSIKSQERVKLGNEEKKYCN